jgi:hypothetical protein
LRLLLSRESDLAAESTCLDAEPVSLVPRYIATSLDMS